MFCRVCRGLLFCHVLFCHVVFCCVMFWCVMFCHARVLFCHVVFCHVLFCHVVFCRVCRGREAGYSGDSRGNLGSGGRGMQGWGWPGGLSLKSNDPSLSGGEQV